MRRKSLPRSLAFALCTFLLLGLACNGIREDELSCEEAVSHLTECCTGFTASRIDCTYTPPQDAGCWATPAVYPEIGTTASECIRTESCATLQASGVCDRAVNAQTNARPGYSNEGGFAQVCP